MSRKFRTINEMLDDLKQFISELGYFQSVETATLRDYDKLEKMVTGKTSHTGCVIVAGDSSIQKDGARGKRTTNLALFVCGKYVKGAVQDGIVDLVDDLIYNFQPDDHQRNTQKVINGVVYEPTGHEHIISEYNNVLQVGLEAIDFRLTDEMRQQRNN